MFVCENGKTISEDRAELTDVAVRGRFTLELASEFDATRELPAPKGRTLVRALPFGVVVSIVPWNAPVSLASMQITLALLTDEMVSLQTWLCGHWKHALNFAASFQRCNKLRRQRQEATYSLTATLKR